MVSLVMQILIACFRTSLQANISSIHTVMVYVYVYIYKCVCMFLCLTYASVVLACLCIGCVPYLNIDKTFNSHFDFQLTYNNKIVQQ